ncbi:terminase small subunit [Vibrio phage K251 g3]
MDFNDTNFLASEVSYTQADKELRDRFIREYLRDYNAYAACVRIGFMDEVALENAKLYMEEPYVRRGIADAEGQRASHLQTEQDNDLSTLPEGFVPHDLETDKQRIVSGLFREAFYKGAGASHASRVSALGKLADIYKLTKEEQTDDKVASNVMVVPAIGSVDAWEGEASKQQAELKQTVKE